MLKKLLAIFLAVTFVMTTAAYAKTQPLITVEYTRIDDNEYLADFILSNNTGVSSFKFSILCKEGTDPKEIKRNSALRGGIFQSNIEKPTVTNDGVVVTALWINSKNYDSDGKLFSIVFETSDSLEPKIFLSYENGDVIDENFNDLPLVIDNNLLDSREDDKNESGNIGGYGGSNGQKDTHNEQDEVAHPTEEAEFVFKFQDVPKEAWYYEAVKFVYEKGIAGGVSDTAYSPDSKVTRGQFITMLCRAYGIKEMIGDNFDDCGNTWYTGYLAAAKQFGISNGVGNNKFAPEKEITREEMVVLIYNYLKSINEADAEVSETTFSDDAKISTWAKNGVAFANNKGYVKGKGNNMFDPKGTATRAELAQIFFNMFK